MGILMCLVGVSLVSGRPGGYTGIGGIYRNMNMNPENMNAAKKASNMALALELENDESLINGAASRGERNTQVYVPSFFTNQPQLVAEQGFARPSRQAQYYELPIYRQYYAPR